MYGSSNGKWTSTPSAFSTHLEYSGLTSIFYYSASGLFILNLDLPRWILKLIKDVRKSALSMIIINLEFKCQFMGRIQCLLQQKQSSLYSSMNQISSQYPRKLEAFSARLRTKLHSLRSLACTEQASPTSWT